ncbi:unnamed protein product [Ceutorhynchus assimilis]|uniref:tRNA/rRNA methyltransferase SpoU type domain-containing protein n=1 Tax=Ceutorhynchus assimilis TaxID=467358 RepID=A0A9N9MQR8_9CUCU|nr:unnamed protein product [Ceutorhynchus assimilis]
MDETSDEIKMWTFLDKAIAETRDVQKLNSLLDIKLGSSHKSNKLHFESDFVLEIIKNNDYELLKKISCVCDTDDHSIIFKTVIDFINTTKNDIKYQLTIINLLHFLFKSFETKIFENLSPKFIYNFLIASLNIPESKSKAFETLTLYFQIFSVSEKILCLNKVFEFSMANNNLDIFCALLNATDKQVMNDENCCFNIENSNFWNYIESCISNQKSHLQKQGGYVLAKYTDSNDESWKAFFILIDVGREKQLHLIGPSLNLFKYIKGLPFLWQKCVYKIYLEHTQTTIVYQVAIEMLKQSYLEENLKEIFRILFPAINKNEYSYLSNEMFEGLHDFCLKLNKNQLEIVAKELIAVSWNSVSFWKVIQSVFDNKASEKINLYQEVISCAANLTNVFIRHTSIQFLIKSFWDETNYEKLIKIGSCCFELTKHNNFDYLQDCKVSLKVLFMFKDDPKKINHLKIWKQCRNYLSDYELGTVLVDFYMTHLDADNCDLFINLFVNASIESQSLNAIIIHEPLFAPQNYNQYQLYASLALARSGIDIKIHKNKEAIIIRYNDKAVIEVKDFGICNACLVDIIFKWYPNYEDPVFVEIVTHIVKSQGNKVLCYLYGKLKSLLEFTTSENLVVHFINLFYQNLLQIKRDQYFKTIAIKFIEALLCSSHYFSTYSFLQTNYYSLVEFSKSSSLIRLSWLQNIRKLYSNDKEVCLNETFLEYIWPIYMQGMKITKDERTEFNLCQEFICNGDVKKIEEYGEFSNPNLLNATSRLSAINILVDFAGKASEIFINYVLEKFNKYYKKRYFPDSAIHYEKLRIIQILLWIVIETREKVPKKLLEVLRTFVFNCFQEETNQNCIKQLLNWLLILASDNVGTVFDWIDKNVPNLSSSVLINVMPAIYHLALTDDNEESLEKTIKMLLPWTMGAQLKLRVYAQDIISRIFKYAQQKNYKHLLDKHNSLQICIATCIESTGDIFENTLKTDLVFLEYFNPVTDKTYPTVFYDIPRLNRVNPTEWMNLNKCPSATFSNAVDTFLSKNQPLINPTSQLTLADPTMHIQKKITPWKSALENSQTAPITTDFILVASLIEKSQNLGGLSRTCEVFGLQTLVFNNAKIVEDKEFKSLSMSSEGWINAVEVKVQDLRDYVLSLQKDGYFVVGAEQTAGSKKLNEFRFPRKMALVLGNEKTGIPPDLIPLLDVCLEIPQFGVTRSLNVHVAGATFIWEYAKQHLV